MSYGSDVSNDGEPICKAIDLMDELRRRSRLTRRIALATVLACCATNSYAEEASSFKSMLKQGWEQALPNQQVEGELDVTPPVPTVVDTEGQSSKPLAQEAAVPPTTILRPQSRVLGVPKPKSRVVDVSRPTIEAALPVAMDQLDQLSKPEIVIEPDVQEQVIEATRSFAELIKERAYAIAGIPQPAEQESFETAATAGIAESLGDTDSSLEIASTNSAAEEVGQSITDDVAEANSAIDAPTAPESVPDTESVIEEISDGPATKSIAQVTPAEKAIELVLPESNAVAIDEAQEKVTESILHPFDEVDPEAPIRLENQSKPLSLAASIHVTRLHGMARESLKTAKHRLQRRATHSAQNYAFKVLHAIVGMHDAKTGGNQHAKSLDEALDAIRESQDFCGRFGVIDQKALKRMVAVHETKALKDQDLQNTSAIEATEAYLAVARDNLVAACEGSQEACEALVMLGQIEASVSTAGATHSASVAVTLHSAAIEVAPNNASGYQAFGTTLASQGLVDQASWAFKQSIQIHPSHSAYRKLLKVARQRGDLATARECLAILRTGNLPSAIPVQTLSPEVFAKTHRPAPRTIQAIQPKKVAPVSSEIETPTTQERVSLRSLFPFSRR